MKRGFWIAGCLALAGCASWGGNVNGDFACRAPKGTCAPTAEIDAQAVAKAARASGNPLVLEGAGGAWAPRTVEADTLGRTDERVLRILFYPYIDEHGHFHEKAVVHAVVAGGGWQKMPASKTPAPIAGNGAASGADPIEGQVVPQAPEDGEEGR